MNRHNRKAALSAYTIGDLDKPNGLQHIRGRLQNADHEDQKDFLDCLNDLTK